MGRAVLYALILGLAAFVLSTALLLRQGGKASEAVTYVSVHDLSAAPTRHEGDPITTAGTIRRESGPPEEFLLVDADLAILLRDYPPSALRTLAGSEVTVRGRFGIDAEDGTYISVESVTPLR